MQKIVYNINYQGHIKGDIDYVSNAVAHSLIEQHVARRYFKTDDLSSQKELESEKKARIRAERRATQRAIRKARDKMMRSKEKVEVGKQPKYETK